VCSELIPPDGYSFKRRHSLRCRSYSWPASKTKETSEEQDDPTPFPCSLLNHNPPLARGLPSPEWYRCGADSKYFGSFSPEGLISGLIAGFSLLFFVVEAPLELARSLSGNAFRWLLLAFSVGTPGQSPARSFQFLQSATPQPKPMRLWNFFSTHPGRFF